MGFVIPEIVLKKVLDYGIKQLRANKVEFYDIFGQLDEDELKEDYGGKFLDELWIWFSTTKIPVVKAWSLNMQNIPCISVHLANETEDETKAAIGDYAGTFDDISETNTGVFTVMVDIGIHASKNGDNVLWLYYIVAYILFKHKLMAHRLGLKLHTFSASDYNKDMSKAMENVWTRWVRFRCTTENFISSSKFLDIEGVNTDPAIGLVPASDMAASSDVDMLTLDPTNNDGLRVGRIIDEDGDDDLDV